MKRLIPLVVAIIAGCNTTGSTAGDDTPIEFPDRCPDTACGAATEITTAPQLVASLSSEWLGYGPYETGCRPASADLAVTGATEIRADTIAPPPNFTGATVAFVIPTAIPGVECLDPTDYFDFTSCAGVRITDATIRTRSLIYDIHPAPGNLLAVVELTPACATTCGATEFACEASHLCYATARDQCAYCFGADNEACACWTGENFDADGASCRYFVSGDVEVSGTCQSGTCEAP